MPPLSRKVTHATEQNSNFSPRVLAWYDRYHRTLDWRVSPRDIAEGVRPDPYRVWLSEVMLQQTTIGAVKSYYARFVKQWPTVDTLAAAEDNDIMKAWAGLGYYLRARNLKACAEVVLREYDGQFPATQKELRALPGIGDYTSAAIAAIAFGVPAVVIDGNVERVITRFRLIATPLPKAKAEVKAFLSAVVPHDRPGDFAQALMDIGSTICTPKRPACALCPLREDCTVLASCDDPDCLPVKKPKPDKPLRHGAAFVAVRPDGAVLLARRPGSGLLGGMSGVPTTSWTARQDGETGKDAAPFAAGWQQAPEISHVFTHFQLHLTVFKAQIPAVDPPEGMWWSMPRDLPDEALPTVMKKVIESAITGATKKAAQKNK